MKTLKEGEDHHEPRRCSNPGRLHESQEHTATNNIQLQAKHKKLHTKPRINTKTNARRSRKRRGRKNKIEKQNTQKKTDKP